MKKLFFSLIGVAILAIGITLTIAWNSGPDAEKEAEPEHITQEEVDANMSENPFGEDETKQGISETDIQDHIHQMSHQKVKADKKWGFEKITDEKIEWLYSAVKDRSDLDNGETYADILEKWKNGDFSDADKDHNAIWNMQGGTTGKAKRTLTDDEEKAYLKEKE